MWNDKGATNFHLYLKWNIHLYLCLFKFERFMNYKNIRTERDDSLSCRLLYECNLTVGV